MQPDYDFLEMITRTKFLPIAKNNVYDTNRIFAIMKPRIKEATGTSFFWNTIAHRNNTITPFAGFSYVPNQSNNPYAQLAVPVAQYTGAISFAYDELVKNTGSKEKLADLALAQTKNLQDSMIERIGIDMYSDGTQVNGMNIILGLRAAISATNTYAGINRSTAGNEFWKANAYTTSCSVSDLENPVSDKYLPKLMNTQYINATHTGAPDFITCSPDVYNMYSNIAQVQNLRIEGGTADLSFPTLKFQGATMLFDKYCPAYHMFMLNTKDWDVHVYPTANFDFVRTKDGTIWNPNQNQLGQTAFVVWMGQLRCDSPREQAILTQLGNG